MPLTFPSPLCDQLPHGEYFMRAPVYGESIQVGTTRVEQTVQLAVAVEPPEIRIRRVDGNSLLVDDVYPADMWREQRQPILGRSIAQLLIHKDNRDGFWAVDCSEGLKVYSESGLENFINLVASIALDKSRKNQALDLTFMRRLLENQ